MSGHDVNSFTLGKWPDVTYKARCGDCGWSTGTEGLKSQQERDDKVRQHIEDAERAKARGGNRAPDLMKEADRYRQNADDPSYSEKDRALWKQLADEADARLGRTGPQWEDVPLL